MLRETNVDVIEAKNGADALGKFIKNNPDIILMDVSMPIMDGFDATALIRLIETEMSLAETPILALTANAMSGDRERCIQAGMSDYMSKPIRKNELIHKIKEIQGVI